MKTLFAPGCALMLYKPELEGKVLAALKGGLGEVEEHLICCHHDPSPVDGTRIVNTCPGCDKRFREQWNVSTISLWEVVDSLPSFPFPDYRGQKMAISDACPTRDQERVHRAVRSLLRKMNIELVEPAKTGARGACCGDSFYGVIPLGAVKEQMRKRASEMPVPDVVVYCVSCANSMQIGGARPHYLVDLLFGEETVPKIVEPDDWHREIDKFISSH